MSENGEETRKGKMFQYDEPLGLPKGTVRGLVFLMITGTVCYSSISSLGVPDIIANAFTMFLGFYLGSRTKAGS